MTSAEATELLSAIFGGSMVTSLVIIAIAAWRSMRAIERIERYLTE